jgi:hypothetical protein
MGRTGRPRRRDPRGGPIKHAMPRDLPRLWVPLLNRLTGSSQHRAVLKNVEAGLTGEGDVDFIAPRFEWEEIRILFQTWAEERGLGPVIACRHIPSALFLLAVDRSVPDFLQLDVRDRITFRGATVFESSDAAHLMEMDARGFRRLRPGAEGLFKLVVNATGPTGRPKPRTLEKENVIDLLRSDPEGMLSTASSVFARVEDSVLTGARAAMEGRWNRRAMATVEGWYMLKILRDPRTAGLRLRARRAKKECEVMRTSLGSARRIPGDVDLWLEEVARSRRHRVSHHASDHE